MGTDDMKKIEGVHMGTSMELTETEQVGMNCWLR
jgi:hypothetical protein